MGKSDRAKSCIAYWCEVDVGGEILAHGVSIADGEFHEEVVWMLAVDNGFAEGEASCSPGGKQCRRLRLNHHWRPRATGRGRSRVGGVGEQSLEGVCRRIEGGSRLLALGGHGCRCEEILLLNVVR